jgi:LuxR family maltose regulon positive regulatory protein
MQAPLPVPTPINLLASKLSPPALAMHQVPRDVVCQRMAQAGGAKLVLVRAPAGFGKTTAMVQARAQRVAQGVDTAWLTLDRADNDVPRFLGGLHQAVRQIVVDAPASAAPLDLVAALASHGAPFVLFFDDFERITEPAVLSLVRELINQLPRSGQLVLGSRSLPDLGLGRLRAAGALLEIDTEHLRFSLQETEQLFARLTPPTAAAAAAAAAAVPALAAMPAPLADTADAPTPLQRHLPALHRKTEGWVAALWLASMALEAVLARRGSVADFIAQFSGSDRAVADYLAEDVLARQTPDVRDFLLRTSILRQLNAPLAQAVSPRQDAQRILAQLDAGSLFLIPLQPGGPAAATTGAPAQGERAWRYHSLFADFLRAQLARERPDELARLHLAASGWYEAQGRTVPAIDHAIEGGDMPHALHLLAPHAQQFLAQGRLRLLARWFAALPPALTAAHPMLQVVSLWATTLTRGPWDAMAQLHASGCEASTDPAVQAHVNALMPMLLAMMDRVDEAHAIGSRHLARLAQAPSGQPFADGVLGNAMAHVLSVMGERTEARRLLDAARRGQGGTGFNRMYSDSVEGLLDLQQGRLRQATARFRLAVGAAPSGSYQPTHGNAWAGVLYAGAVYEAHQLAEAEHLLNVYLPLARDVGLPDHMILSHTMRARLALLRGDIDGGLHALAELEGRGPHRQLPRVVASARLERARVLLLQGQPDAAVQALDRADDTAVWARVAQCQMNAHDVDDLVIGRLRWQTHHGDAALAARVAGEAAAAALAAQRQRRALKLQLLQALALQRAGSAADLAGAVALMVHAVLPLAQAEGFVRLLLDEGPQVGRLLRRVRQAVGADCEFDDAGMTPLLHDALQRLIGLAGPAAELPTGDDAGATDDGGLAGAQSAHPDAAGPGALSEPLTRKEIRVLQLLAEGYSNSALADKLFVSDSTVRTHLRNINLKLGARSRTQAVAIARRRAVIA